MKYLCLGLVSDLPVANTRLFQARVRIGYFCCSKQEESDGGHSEAESVA